MNDHWKANAKQVESLTMEGVNLTVATGERFVRRLQHRNTERLYCNTEIQNVCNTEIQNVCIATQKYRTFVLQHRIQNVCQTQKYSSIGSTCQQQLVKDNNFPDSPPHPYPYIDLPQYSPSNIVNLTVATGERFVKHLYCNTEIQQYRVNLTIATVLIFGRKINKVFCLCCLVAKLNYLNFRICFINFLGKNIYEYNSIVHCVQCVQ